MKQLIHKFDNKVLGFIKKYNMPLARLAIFVVYVWFGVLKIFDLSPANPLVQSLLERTLPFISFSTFIILLALFEVLIGILFLFKGLERLVMALLAIHMVTTFMPLILLPQVTWHEFFVPTLEGQYIIKNVLIIALSFVIVSQVEFLEYKK